MSEELRTNWRKLFYHMIIKKPYMDAVPSTEGNPSNSWKSRVWQRTLKKLRIKSGTKSTNFEKKYNFFQSALISAILTHFQKNLNSNCVWLALFFLFTKFQRQFLILKINRPFQIFYRRFYKLYVHFSRWYCCKVILLG